MSQCQNESKCKQDNLINTQREMNKKANCGQSKPATPCPCNTKVKKVTECTIVLDPCQKPKCQDKTFCKKINNECGNFGLTDYAKDYCSEIGRLNTNCVCVKLNGLQDTCRHSGCYSKIGCMSKPFPTCPPAREWKNDYMCNNLKKNKKCCD